MAQATINVGCFRGEKARVYIAEIDTVRAIAVLLVLLFHAYPQWFPGGFIGVDVFFVVSGFVIARAYLDDLISGKATVADFIHARFRRLLPAVAVVLTTTTVAAYLLLLPDDLLRYANSLVA
jgi:peptidoglycan/LPS O-acetylase OafA/YrhL